MQVYADNAATTRMSDKAVAAMTPYFQQFYGNPSSLHTVGQQAAEALADARRRVADCLGCSFKEIYFTSGGSEADNQAIVSAARIGERKGKKHIISTAFEHHAVLHTLKKLEKEGFEVTLLDVGPTGTITPQQVAEAIREDTCLVTIMYANNEIGSILPIPEIGKVCHEKGVLFHTDAVQAAGHLHINVKEQNIDMLSLSGHKFHGPKGVGALYIRKGVKIKPRTFGGSQEMKIRPGTEAMPAIAGFGAAARALPDPKRELEHITMLRDYMVSKLTEIDDVVINSPPDAFPFVTNVSVLGIKSEPMLNFLSERGICVSSGSACSKGKKSHVLTQMNLDRRRLDSPLRISFSRFTTVSEIDALVLGIREGKKTIRAIK